MSYILYHQASLERERINSEIQQISIQLNQLPEGKFLCINNQNYYKWFLYNGHKKTYIPKSEREYAEKLARRKYLSEQLKNLQSQLYALDNFLDDYPISANSHEELLAKPGYAELLTPYFQPVSIELTNWAKEPYSRNPKYPDHCIHKTASGIHVRSKSEAIIDMVLSSHRIPFRYECALELNSITIYPDFTIRHPVTGEFFYYEHFGMMDDPEYCRKASSKIYLYSSNGIIPSIKLLTTFETKEHPLSVTDVEQLVKQYFLT